MGHLVTLLQKKRIIVQDGFNRADNAASMGNANTGQAWQPLVGTWGISGNRAYLAVNIAEASTVVESTLSNCNVGVTFSTVITGGGVPSRIVFRAVDANNLFLLQSSAGTSYDLYRRQASAYTSIGTYATTPQAGDIIKVVLVGSSIKIFINGVLRISAIDSFNSTATLHGIGANTNASMYDNFLVEAL